MDTITQFGKHEYGVKAGQSLAKLFRELGTEVADLPQPTDQELNTNLEAHLHQAAELREWISSDSHSEQPDAS